ncbi:MAG: OsmC family protein, partial [Ferrimicrobium sp.]
YSDDPEAAMPESERPMRITTILLRPRVVVRGGSVQRVVRLVDKAYGECYIANSLICTVALEPMIEVI